MPNLMVVLAVVLGVGFLIFIHELGHFVVAKLVGIRVLGFSIGFGPRILGFRRGETDYRISLFPIGGYVKMAGESPDDGAIIDDGDFRSKTVGQRAAVISAGVIMNAIFAFVLFVIAFSIGVPFQAPEIGGVVPGSPAWSVGLEPGPRILSVNGNRVYDFSDVSTEIAVAKKDEPVRLELEEDGRDPYEVLVTPRSGGNGFFEIGITPSNGGLAVDADSYAAEQSLQDRDVIVSIDGEPTASTVDLSRALQAFTAPFDEPAPESQVIDMRVRRGDEIVDVPYTLQWEEVGTHRIGISHASNRILAFRDASNRPAAIGLETDDVLLRVGGRDIGGARDLVDAVGAVPDGQPIEAVYTRNGKRLPAVSWDLDAVGREWLTSSIALGATPLVTVRVEPGMPAAQAGLRTGDRLLSVNGRETEEFVDVIKAMKGYDGTGSIEVRYRRDGEESAANVTPATVRLAKYDFGIREKLEVVRSESIPEACADGFSRTIYTTKKVFVILERMFYRGTVSTKNMGGIVMIAVVSYRFAEVGIGKLLYFLALLSVNLAILNLLPIPVLDGGQLVFLIVEKIKGSPVSERVQQYAALAGVALVLFLVLYVTYNDIARLIRWQ